MHRMLTRFSTLLAFTFLLSACFSDDVEPGNTVITPDPDPSAVLPIENVLSATVSVNKIYALDQALLASSDAGLYSNVGGEWRRISPDPWQILDVAILGSQEFLVSVVGEQDNQLWYTDNQGQNWQPRNHNFDDGGTGPVVSFYFDDSSDRLYGQGAYVLAVSEDHGSDWDIVTGEWDGFAGAHQGLLIYNQAKEEFWFSSPSSTGSGILYRHAMTNDETDTWTDIFNLPEGPFYYDGLINQYDSNRLAFATSRGILVTEDNGSNWRLPDNAAEAESYRAVVMHPNDPDTLYTAQGRSGYQNHPLVVECSTDFGQTWEITDFGEDITQGRVLSLRVHQESDAYYLYLGFEGMGIKRVALQEIPCS